jgi:hypothetical protein
MDSPEAPPPLLLRADMGGVATLTLSRPAARNALSFAMLGALADALAPHRAKIRHMFHGHLHRPLGGSWLGIPFTSLRGTSHQVALDLSERDSTPGSHEPPAYALVRVSEESVVVHAHDFLDQTGNFDL